MRLLSALLCVLLLAGVATADPVIERVDTSLAKKRRLTVTVEALFSGKGELRVEGEVNGRTVKKRRKVRRAGPARLRVRIDARRVKLRKLDEPLVFSLRAVAEERDGGSASRDVERTVPVPVVFLPGLGNELPGGDVASAAFAGALDLAAGGAYDTAGDDPTLVVHPYESLSETGTTTAKALKKRVRKLLRGTSFGRVDLVGYSNGGLVARRFVAEHGAGKVRRMVFLGTPNQGAPLAQLLGIGLGSNVLGNAGNELLPGLGDVGDLVGAVVDAEAAEDVLRGFYPSYPWLYVTLDIPFLGGRFAVTPELIERFGGLVPQLAGLDLDLSSPLTILNATPPSNGTAYFAIGYSAVPTEALGVPIGTLDEIDVTPLLQGGAVDPLALATGDGDGLVPWRSLVMSDTPDWAERIAATDLGAGTHVTLLADPACIARVVEILTE